MHRKLPRALREDELRDIQPKVYKLYVAHGLRVWWMSQARPTKQTRGPGDLIVFAPQWHTAWWHETKTPKGRLSEAQSVFRELCLAAGWDHVRGGVDEAAAQIAKARADWKNDVRGIRLVENWRRTEQEFDAHMDKIMRALPDHGR